MKAKGKSTKNLNFYLTTGAVSILLAALAAGFYLQQKPGEVTVGQRWYTPAQVSAGEVVFAENCLVCHGAQGRGTANWRQRLADGSFPPPPLNGTAHTWHHPLPALRQTVKDGSIALGGSMPAFGEKLSEEEIDSVLAYVQSLWQEEVYKVWSEKINTRK